VKDNKLYLFHISECIEKVIKFTSGGRDAFHADDMMRDAVIRNLQIMAESAQRISEDLKTRHPEIEWRDLSAFRNVAVHDYLGTDWNIVWDIVERDLPILQPKIHRILEETP
jgi:uncharacterized protein with HEPN domain